MSYQHLPKLVAAIGNVNMALGHEGLTRVAAGFKINLSKLGDKELVLFLNKARDRLKILGARGIVMGYVKMPDEQKLPLGAVQYLSKAFSAGGKVDIDMAVKDYVENALKRRAKPKSSLEIVRGLE